MPTANFKQSKVQRLVRCSKGLVPGMHFHHVFGPSTSAFWHDNCLPPSLAAILVVAQQPRGLQRTYLTLQPASQSTEVQQLRNGMLRRLRPLASFDSASVISCHHLNSRREPPAPNILLLLLAHFPRVGAVGQTPVRSAFWARGTC